MEQILIPIERAHLIDKELHTKMERRLKCKILLHDETQITINGEPYDEYNAKNVLLAFGRGFSFDQACKLLSENYFFKYTNLKDMLRNEKLVERAKARLIGEDGRAKEYIESVSEANLMIYDNTVSLIGSIESLQIATVALEILLGGGKHKSAYAAMEKARRKAKEAGLI